MRYMTTICFGICLMLAAGLMAEEGALTPDLITSFEQSFEKNPDNKRIINAVTNNKIQDLSLDREKMVDHNKFFDHTVNKSGIVNQRGSGRCWLFAGVNVLSPKVMTRLQLADFEISEPYLTFYDKLEKANRFLERIIELRDKPIDDRSLQGEIQYLFGDGGWWHYFTSLTEKYGIVPLEAMPETKQSVSTKRFNALGKSLLRADAAELRQMHRDGKKVSDLRKRKEEMLADIYKLLVYNYGKPPTDFVFRYEYKDKEDTTKTEKELIEKKYTPKSFFKEYFGENLPEYVALSNVPTKEYGKLFLLEESRNIYDREDIKLANLPIEKLKDYTKKSLLDSQIVWFACDVGKDNLNDSGIFRSGIYDYNTTFDLNFDMSKADKITYGDISPNHAMVITAIDTASNGTPIKWQVENSWGTKPGDKGIWYMYDDWYDDNLLLIIVDKNLLEDDEKRIFDQEPIVIKDWEPFFLQLRNIE